MAIEPKHEEMTYNGGADCNICKDGKGKREKVAIAPVGRKKRSYHLCPTCDKVEVVSPGVVVSAARPMPTASL